MTLPRPAPARALAFAALFLSAAALQAGCSSVDGSPCRPLSAMGPAKMLKIMESMDLAAEEVAYLDSKALSWKLNGASTTILFLSGGEALQFYVAVTDTRATKDDLMEFNKKWRYSRSYMDEDGDPVLELDLDLAGGVCEGRVKDWLATCELAFSTWIEALPRSPSGPAVPEAGTKGGTPSFRFPPVGPLSPDY